MFTGGSSENGHGTESLRKGMRKILRGLERGDEPKEAENSIPNPTQPEGARKSENTIQKHETVDSSKSGIHDEVVNNRGGKFGNNKRGETENDGSVLSSLPKRMKIRVVEDAAPQRKKTEVHSNKESKKQKEVEVECYKKEEEEEDSEEELLVLAKKAPILAKKPFDFFGLWSWNKEDEEPSLRCFPDSNNKTARKEQGETSSEDDVSHLKKLWKGESEKDSAAIAQRKKLLAADSVCRGPSMEDFGGVSDPPDMRSRSRDDEISAEDSQKGKRGAVKRRKSSSVVENIEASLMCESEATKLRQDLLRRMQLENEVKVVKEKINNLQEALRKIDEEKSEAFKLVAGTQGLLMKAIGLQKKWEEVAKEFDLRLASNVSSLAAARSKVEEAFENILTAEAFDRALQLYLAKTAALEQASNAMEDQLEGAIKEIEVHERTLRDAVDRIRKDPKTLEPYEKNVKESIAVVEDFAKICRSRLGGENVRGQKKNLALADEAEETVQEVLMEARQRHHRLEAEYQRTKKEVDALRDEAEKAYQKLGDAVLETGMLSYKKERLEETATEKTKEVEKIHKSLVRAEKRLDHLRKEFVELCAQSETQLPKQASEKISKFFEIHPNFFPKWKVSLNMRRLIPDSGAGPAGTSAFPYLMNHNADHPRILQTNGGPPGDEEEEDAEDLVDELDEEESATPATPGAAAEGFRANSRPSPTGSWDGILPPSHQIRVGSDWQAPVPKWETPEATEDYNDHATMVWSPDDKTVTEDRLEDYLGIAKDRRYNEEQALFLLMQNGYDVDKSLQALSDFVPSTDAITKDEAALFAQVYTLHGKSFNRIQQMMPSMSVGTLIRHYYGWKKRTPIRSVVGIKAGLYDGITSGDDDSSSAASRVVRSDQEDSDSDSHLHRPRRAQNILILEDEEREKRCSNCTIPCHILVETQMGAMCKTCAVYFRENNHLRPTNGPPTRFRGYKKKGQIKPPTGIYLNHDELVDLMRADSDFIPKMDVGIRNMERDIVHIKHEIAKMEVQFRCDQELHEALNMSLDETDPSSSWGVISGSVHCMLRNTPELCTWNFIIIHSSFQGPLGFPFLLPFACDWVSSYDHFTRYNQ
ncbi:unnamed protein product [Cyprideis torosa]|uniref:Uncharacterized protein n=1 Tax=Cyprideis torosa TaxID=163714 RepID=A0A7R8ZIQ5_9CRUS|nr:unnamed protein product [Cyprideis torosa]CAG0885233.1 unnamed protein product [Cyprideis torosa]